MALFRELAAAQGRKDGSVRIRWTVLTQLWLATAYPEFAGWLRTRGLTPWIAMYGANLTRADLTRANLTRADLTGANLTRANLTRADLSGANLTRANLYGANLTRANLTRADLTGPTCTGPT
jgi:uncharacterized protein YjbI with pentapeptide repeats